MPTYAINSEMMSKAANIRNKLLEQYNEGERILLESVKQIISLNEQKAIFEREMNEANSQIEILKVKINTDYKKRDAVASKENITNYLEQKNKYNYARTYIIYINHFLSDYVSLNDYNKKLLDTLINNKDAIVKEAYVVIPSSWAGLLKEFDLLYEESEYKATK